MTVNDSVVVLHPSAQCKLHPCLAWTNAVVASVTVISGGYEPQRDLTNAGPPERMQEAPTVAKPGAPEGQREIASCLAATRGYGDAETREKMATSRSDPIVAMTAA